jgi:hypothetical protein
MDATKLIDYGVASIALGLVLSWLGYKGDFFVSLGLLVVFVGFVMKLTKKLH